MRFRNFVVVYLIVLSLEIFAGATENLVLQYVTKPLLMPLLMIYWFIAERTSDRRQWFVLAALLFSWAGDVILLANKTSPKFFIGGLVAFLIAHVFYIAFFVAARRVNAPESRTSPFILTAIAVYTVTLFAVLVPFAGDLLLPIAVYAITISLMLAACFRAFDPKTHNFGRFCIYGALLFVVSDSVLAINRFAVPFRFGHAVVMITYAIAQLLIVEGARRMFARRRETAAE